MKPFRVHELLFLKYKRVSKYALPEPTTGVKRVCVWNYFFLVFIILDTAFCLKRVITLLSLRLIIVMFEEIN